MDLQAYQKLQPLLRVDTPTPLYHQLFGLLRERIISGEIPDAQRLPTEFELAGLFSVSRITAKRAMDELAAVGLVSRRRGRGTFVTHSPRTQTLEAPLLGLMESLETIARETTVEIIEFERREPPAALGKLFGCALGHSLAQAVRVRHRDGEPFAHYQSWTDTEDPRFNGKAMAQLPRIHLFRQLGMQMGKIEQTLSAVAADAIIAARLAVSPGSPLLSLERRSYGHEGALFDLLLVHYRPDKFRYHMCLGTEQGV